MADFAETLLPSGRAIRIERLSIKDYRAAKRRAGDKDAKTGVTYQEDLGHELLLSSMRGITAEPVKLVMVTPEATSERPEPKPEMDFDKTLEAVPEATYLPCTYQSLITAGPTSLAKMFNDDVSDYEAACLFARQVMTPASPLDLVVMIGRKRMVSRER